MKGVLLQYFFDYVEYQQGKSGLRTFMRRLDWYPPRILTSHDYDDHRFTELIQIYTDMFQHDGEFVLEGFGYYALQERLKPMYPHYFKQAPNAKRFLKKLDQIHREVMQQIPGAKPPRFQFIDDSSDGIKMIYRSPRTMLPFLLGALKGVGAVYNQTIQTERITQPTDGNDGYHIYCTFHNK